MSARPPRRDARARAAGTLLLTLVCGGACAPKYYVPSTQNVPLLDGPGALAAAFAFGDSRAELQGAYAVGDDLAVLADASFFEQKDDSVGDGGRGQLVEVGVGYRRALAERFRFELFGLLGGGDLENHFPSTLAANPTTDGRIEAKLLRYGVQTALGLRARHVHAAASARVVRLRYSDVSGSLVFGGVDQVDFLRSESSHVLVEPALTLRVGSASVKGQLQLGWSVNLTHSDFRQEKGHLTAAVVYTPVRGGTPTR